MGIYDREYYRRATYRSGWITGTAPVVKWLIIVNVAVFLLQLVVPQAMIVAHVATSAGSPVRNEYWQGSVVDVWFALFPSLVGPGGWQVWRLVSYAFLHSGIWHILFNMLFLYWFGRELESMYGSKEFLRFYLAAAAIAALAHLPFYYLGLFDWRPVIGASGAVAAVVFLYTLYYPRRQIWIWGIVPLELRWLALIFLITNLLPILQSQTTGVAHAVHLGGAAYGVLYKVLDLRFSRLLRGQFTLPRLHLPRRRPRIRVLVPPEEKDMDRQVDEVLAKISREGSDNLTERERKILEQASRHYKQRRQ